MARTIGEILDNKGTDVHTIGPDATLEEVLAALDRHRIGALVVSADGSSVDGVVSERDIVRVLARSGAGVLSQPVRSAMTEKVGTCSRGTTCDEVMATMTSSRFRHMPVVEEGRLAGLVSIGDVVKSRIDDLELTTDSLTSYVTGSSY